MTVQEREQRVTAMRQRRLEGRTLQEIGDEYGITRERVRQLLVDQYIVFNEVCRNCGSDFQTHKPGSHYCGECACETCGRKLTYNQVLAGTRYCVPKHNPDYKGAGEGATYRKLERGLYIRMYPSGARPNEFYYVYSPTGSKAWHAFEDLEEARRFRDSNRRRTPESVRIRKGVIARLKKGPASIWEIAEEVEAPAKSLGSYLRHMKEDGLIRESGFVKGGKQRPLPVWELVRRA